MSEGRQAKAANTAQRLSGRPRFQSSSPGRGQFFLLSTPVSGAYPAFYKIYSGDFSRGWVVKQPRSGAKLVPASRIHVAIYPLSISRHGEVLS